LALGIIKLLPVVMRFVPVKADNEQVVPVWIIQGFDLKMACHGSLAMGADTWI